MEPQEQADGQIWSLLIYRLPTQPSSARVAIWRDLRRLGALPLQQSCIVMPERPTIGERLNEIVDRIKGLGGTSHLFRLTDLSPRQAGDLRAAWSSLRSQEYAEIIEECETKFLKEVDFEIFRDNLTSAEAEELEADLDKVRAWYVRVHSRDWFGADHRLEVEAAIAKCETRLEEFTTLVFERENNEGPSLERPTEMEWGETSQGQVVPLARGRGRRKTKRPI
jgi:hypothetical protein